MSEIRIPVRIQHITQAHTLGARGFRNVTAFVDPGASRTIVSAALAKELGIRRLKHLGGVSGLHAVEGAGGIVRVPVGFALVDAIGGGCSDPQPLVVGISDELAAVAQADMILGHDYMQAVPFVVRPYRQSALCETPRPNPARRSPAGRAKRKPSASTPRRSRR